MCARSAEHHAPDIPADGDAEPERRLPPMASETEKPIQYYAADRSHFLSWIGGHHRRALDIGCGAGHIGEWLAERGTSVVGVEVDPASAKQAAVTYERVFNETIESALPKLAGPFDLIVCADVLEHLVDPWAVLAALRKLSSESTVLAASIPNIRHWRALGRIAVGRGFKYEPEGIFDRTHLRFFTRSTIAEMLTDTGWRPERWGGSMLGDRATTLSRWTRGRLDEWLTYQWYVAAVPR